MVCQHALSAFVDSLKITDIIFFPSFLFHSFSEASQYTQKRDATFFSDATQCAWKGYTIENELGRQVNQQTVKWMYSVSNSKWSKPGILL